MRIIAGSVGGRRLKAPRGLATRPTADRVREALFNILSARGPAPERVLDLYAGSGALGLEALSRGAGAAVFVEQDADAAALIGDNARELGFGAAAKVVAAPVRRWLERAGTSERFGWVFLDPPYATQASAGRRGPSREGELDRALALTANLLTDDGIALAEHEWRAEPKEAYDGLALLERRRYGQTAVSFYLREAK